MAGFTLLELILVLVLLGFVTVLTVPALSKTLHALKLRSVTQDVAGTMRHVRERAILERTPQWLAFDIQEDLYWTGRGNPEEAASEGLGEQPFVRLPTEINLNGFTWINGERTEDQGWFAFYPDGSASGGTVLLAMREGKKTTEISLNPFTGLASVAQGPTDAQ